MENTLEQKSFEEMTTGEKRKFLQDRVAQAQHDYAENSQKLKAIYAAEKADKLKDKFGEYKFKVWWHTTPEDTCLPVEDEDYAFATYSKYGLAALYYPDSKNHDTFLLVKSEAELPRAKDLIARIQAAAALVNKETKEPRPVEEAEVLHKVILGET